MTNFFKTKKEIVFFTTTFLCFSSLIFSILTGGFSTLGNKEEIDSSTNTTSELNTSSHPSSEKASFSEEQLSESKIENESSDEIIENNYYEIIYEAEDNYASSPDSLPPLKNAFASNKKIIDISECGTAFSLYIDDFSFFNENTTLTLELSIAVNSDTTLYSNFASVSSERYLMEPDLIDFNKQVITPGTEEEKLSLCDCGYCDTSLYFRKITATWNVSNYSSSEDLYVSLSIGGPGVDLGMEPVYLDYVKIISENELGNRILM